MASLWLFLAMRIEGAFVSVASRGPAARGAATIAAEAGPVAQTITTLGLTARCHRQVPVPDKLLQRPKLLCAARA